MAGIHFLRCQLSRSPLVGISCCVEVCGGGGEWATDRIDSISRVSLSLALVSGTEAGPRPPSNCRRPVNE